MLPNLKIMRAILVVITCIVSYYFAFSQQQPIAEIEGKLIIEDIPSKIIMKSPDGKCWQLSVANNGQLTSNSVLCESYFAINVTTTNTDTYKYEFDLGDEEGAIIHTAPQFAQLSEISILTTPYFHWQYQYMPVSGFIGSDEVTLAFYTGSDGASPSTHVEYLTIYFTITE